MFFLPFMILEYPFILEIRLENFLEIYNSLIKIIFNNQIFLIYEKDKELKRGESDDQAQLIEIVLVTRLCAATKFYYQQKLSIQ